MGTLLKDAENVVQQCEAVVAELVYAHVSEACVARLGSSSLPHGTDMIGIFDSGSGGLTVLSALRERLPMADVLYLGDISRAPYGERAREELSRFTMEMLVFLEGCGATSIVSACNSVSASLAISLFDTFQNPMPLIEMVGPTASFFRGSRERILLVATPATVLSGIYQNAFTMIGVSCDALAIDGLAGAIEFGAPDTEIERIIRTALEPRVSNYDTLILACTHYPLVRNLFERVVGTAVRIVDPAEAVAERAVQRLSQEVGAGRLSFVITKESPEFRARVAHLFPGDHSIEIATLGVQ